MQTTYHYDIYQGTPEWRQARCGLITASEVGKLMTGALMAVADNATSRGVVYNLAAQRITGYVEKGYESADMMRGSYEEALARDKYAELEMIEPRLCGFATCDIGGGVVVGCSPDALIGDNGGIEIKSRNNGIQMSWLADDCEVPKENMPQIQACLMVTGRDWWDYVSYSNGLCIGIRRVFRDDAMIEKIKVACIEAESKIRAAVDEFNDRLKTGSIRKVERQIMDIEVY